MPPREVARIRVSADRELVLRVNDQAGCVDVRLWSVAIMGEKPGLPLDEGLCLPREAFAKLAPYLADALRLEASPDAPTASAAGAMAADDDTDELRSE
jgi:hypothetical protein